MDSCNTLMPILRIVAYLLKIIQWAIPMLLIAFATFDFVKGIMANEEKAMEKAKSDVGKRLLYAVIVFLVPVLVRFMFRLVSGNINSGGLTGPTDWISCFNQALSEV